MASHTIVVASLWDFYDVQSLIQQFDACMKNDSPVRCSYDQTKKQFVIQCRAGEDEQIAQEFLVALRKYVDHELEKHSGPQSDPFDASHPLVARLPELRPPRPPNYHIKVSAQEQGAEDRVGASGEVKQLIRHEAISTSIQLDIDETLARTTSFNLDVLRTLGKITNSRVELCSNAIKIWSDTVEDMEAAANMVTTITSTHSVSAARRRVYDLYSMPALPGHKFRFSFSAAIVDVALTQANADFATDYYDLRAVVWDAKSLQYLCTVSEGSPIRYPPHTPNRWSERANFAYGADHANPKNWTSEDCVLQRQLSGRLSPNQISRVAHWAQQVDEAQILDPLAMFGGGQLLESPVLKDAKRGRIEIVESSFQQPGPSPGLQNDEKICSPNELLATRVEQGAVDRTWSKSKSVTPCPIPAVDAEPLNASISMGLPEQPEQASLQQPADQKTIYRELRDFRHTAPLKTGGEPTVRKDSSPSVFHRVSTAMVGLLASLEANRKRGTNIDLQIGQIFTRSTTIPRRYQCSQNRPSEPFAREEWATIFAPQQLSEGKAITLFSSKITNAWEDAEYIANLPHPTRKHMFEKTAESDILTYRVHLLNERSGDRTTIEITNNNKPAEIYAMRHDYGEINVHFPKNVWDARICLLYQDFPEPEAYDALRMLANNIWIGAVDEQGARHGKLYCKNPFPHISIVTVELRRDIVHQARGTDRDVSMHLVRVEVLEVTELAGGFCAFSAADNDQEHPGAWWEVRLVSKELNKLLHMREGIEVNGHHYWAQSQILQSSLHILLDFAELIVRNIDDVGCSSRTRIGMSASAVRGSSRRMRSAASG